MLIDWCACVLGTSYTVVDQKPSRLVVRIERTVPKLIFTCVPVIAGFLPMMGVVKKGLLISKMFAELLWPFALFLVALFVSGLALFTREYLVLEKRELRRYLGFGQPLLPLWTTSVGPTTEVVVLDDWPRAFLDFGVVQLLSGGNRSSVGLVPNAQMWMVEAMNELLADAYPKGAAAQRRAAGAEVQAKEAMAREKYDEEHPEERRARLAEREALEEEYQEMRRETDRLATGNRSKSAPAEPAARVEPPSEPEGLCQNPWFDANSATDRVMTTYDEKVVPVEIDNLKSLPIVLGSKHAPTHRFVVYQNWGAWQWGADGERCRPYQAVSIPVAREIGRRLRGSPCRRFIVICTTFMPGAIRAFADAVGPGQVEMMGFWWYFSGDDITDESAHATDVAWAAGKLGLQRISVLTGAFDARVERALSEGLRASPTVTHCHVFIKDDEKTFPRQPTPLIDALLQGRR